MELRAHDAEARLIERTLAELRCGGQVVQVQEGPRLVRYGLEPGAGVRMHTLAGLEADLARVLETTAVHIWAPVPGTRLVGIDVPRREPCRVLLGEVLRPTWDGAYPPLTLPLGLDVVGQPVLADLATMPHMLVAGSSGSGKSTLLHALIGGLALRNSPDALRLVLIDLKGTELPCWAQDPHVISPVLTDIDQTVPVLSWLEQEISHRAQRFAAAGVRDIAGWNARRLGSARMPALVVVCDELGELMARAPRVIEPALVHLAALGRAVGVHLIMATQRPSVDVISGLIKANLPARIACRLPTSADSRVVLDQGGAEDLLGHGDALFLAQDGVLVRIQTPLLRTEDITVIAKTWQAKALYDYRVST